MYHGTVFDDMISGTAPVYTSTEFNHRLASHQQMAICAVIDNVSATTNFDLSIEQSPDGRNWIARSDVNQLSPPAATMGNGEIEVIGMVINQTYCKMFSDPGIVNIATTGSTGVPIAAKAGTGAPLLTFVRFRLQLSASATAHVKVHVTLR
jgi:hypothetical protein